MFLSMFTLSALNNGKHEYELSIMLFLFFNHYSLKVGPHYKVVCRIASTLISGQKGLPKGSKKCLSPSTQISLYSQSRYDEQTSIIYPSFIPHSSVCIH